MIKEDRIHLYADDAQKIIQILLRLICSQWNMLTLIIRFERFFFYWTEKKQDIINQTTY